MSIDLFCQRFVMADNNETMTEVFQFLALALVLLLSGGLVVGSTVNEDGYTLQAVPLVEKVGLGISAGFGASDCTCESHLSFFGRHPSRNAFTRDVWTLYRRRLPVRVCRLNLQSSRDSSLTGDHRQNALL